MHLPQLSSFILLKYICNVYKNQLFSSSEKNQQKNDTNSRQNDQRLTTMTEEAEEYNESTTNSPANTQNMPQV